LRTTPAELVELGNHPVHAHLGGELDLFSGLLVGRIGRGDDQSVVALAEHDDAEVGAGLGVEQPCRQALYIDGIQVEQRSRESDRHGVGQVGRRHGPESVSSAMKLVRLLWALRYRSSAAFWPSLPADTNARPRPGRAMEGVSSGTESTDAIGL